MKIILQRIRAKQRQYCCSHWWMLSEFAFLVSRPVFILQYNAISLLYKKSIYLHVVPDFTVKLFQSLTKMFYLSLYEYLRHKLEQSPWSRSYFVNWSPLLQPLLEIHIGAHLHQVYHARILKSCIETQEIVFRAQYSAPRALFNVLCRPFLSCYKHSLVLSLNLSWAGNTTRQGWAEKWLWWKPTSWGRMLHLKRSHNSTKTGQTATLSASFEQGIQCSTSPIDRWILLSVLPSQQANWTVSQLSWRADSHNV